MPDSYQDRLKRVRPPRVKIDYKAETYGEEPITELPFVVGVMADLSSQAKEENKKAYKERRFVQIDRDNFSDVMKGSKPRLAFKVDNKLTNDDSKMGVELRFNNMDDFEPEQVVNQVEPLRKLLEVRRQLSDLLAKTDGNDKLVDRLQEIISNTELLQKVGQEAGVDASGKKEGANE
jgi:type VI secretion system protein ImpB